MAISSQNGFKLHANNGHWDTTQIYIIIIQIFFTLQVFTGENVAHLSSHFTFFTLEKKKRLQSSPHDISVG